MKNSLLCILLSFSALFSLAQHPEKIIPFSTGSSIFVRDIAVDADKNTFVTGYFSTAVYIDDSTYTSKGSSDIIIASLDSNNAVQWVQKLGGIGEDRMHAITIAADGSLYVTGYFSDDVLLQNGDTLTHSLEKDALLLKLTKAGEIVWHKTLSTVKDDEFYDVSCGADSKPVVCGYFSGNAEINTLAGTQNYVTSIAQPLLAQLSQNGDYEWATSLNTEEKSYMYGIHHTVDNSILTTGHFSGSLTTSDSKTIASEGGQDIFIAQFDNTGSYINQNTFGSSGDDAGYALASTANDIYLTGNFSTELRLANTPNLVGFGARDGVVLKLDNDLKTVDAAQIGGQSNDQAYNIAIGDGSIYITGSYRGLGSFNGSDPTHPRTSQGGEDIYVSKYNANLDLQWTQTAGGGARDVATGIAYQNGSIWISGTSIWIDFPYVNATIDNAKYAGTTIIQLKDCNLSPTLLAQGGKLTPQASFDEIQWLDCDKNLEEIKDATSDSFLLESDGLYAARITQNGCEAITECYSYKSTISSRSIAKLTSSVWPNPTTGSLHISIDQPLIRATVVNALGKSIYQSTTAKDKIDASDWMLGYYFLILETADGKSVKKVVKM